MKLENLNTKFLGKEYLYYQEIDSTQDEIWRLIENNKIKNGLLVFSDIQKKAYGTHGRKWYTDESNNIAFSFYVDTNCLINNLEGITTEIAQLIRNILKKEYDLDLTIKLPNDIYFNGKKIGGILCQSKVVGKLVKYMVIGIGINTNKMNFSEDIKNIATSIYKEANIRIDNEKIVKYFCEDFEKILLKRIGENR